VDASAQPDGEAILPRIEAALGEATKVLSRSHEAYVLLGIDLANLWNGWVTPGCTSEDCRRDTVFREIGYHARDISLDLSAEVARVGRVMVAAHGLDARACEFWALHQQIRDYILRPTSGKGRDVARGAVAVHTDLQNRILEELHPEHRRADIMTAEVLAKTLNKSVRGTHYALRGLKRTGEVKNRRGLGYYRKEYPPMPVTDEPDTP
jgi:hypothetical protein